jgi:hypothetical protein
MLIALFIALAGWDGKVHFTHDPPRKSGGSDGAIHVAGNRVRIEEPTPMGDTVILYAEGKTRILFPAQRQFIEIDPADAALATVPPTSLAEMERTGEEAIDGQPCDIWTRKLETKLGRLTQRLWVPRGQEKKKLFFFLREATITPRGATRADVSEVKVRDQPGALFRIPAGYKKK